jgi:hypothetical protein
MTPVNALAKGMEICGIEPSLSIPLAAKAVQDAARRTSGRNELQHKHGDSFDQISPEVGQLDEQSVVEQVV